MSQFVFKRMGVGFFKCYGLLSELLNSAFSISLNFHIKYIELSFNIF